MACFNRSVVNARLLLYGFPFHFNVFFHSPKVEVGLFRLKNPFRFTIALTYFQSQYLANKLDPAWALLPRWDVSSLASSL